MIASERALIRRLKRRDERAFYEVMRQHRDRVYSISLRLLGNHSEAEDITQEVFVTIFKSIDSFREDAKFSTWVYRIAVNHSKNRIRYLARRKSNQKNEYNDSFAQESSHAVAPHKERSPADHAMLSEVEIQLQNALLKLDELSKTLIVLRDIEELSYQEICVIAELPLGTVKSKIHRARASLRSILESYVKQ